MADSSNCPWTVTDKYGNKLDARRAGLTDDRGRTYTIGPSRPVPGHVPGKGEISWARAERMLRRGRAHLSLDVPGLGKVRFETPQGPWEGMLVKGRKTSSYQWGCPDVTLLKATGWQAPTEAEREAIADAMLLSTLARVRSDASENAGHARAVIETAVGRMFAPGSLLAHGLPASDNRVVRGLVAQRISLDGGGDERSVFALARQAVEDGLRAGGEFSPEVAALVKKNYPKASVPEAIMLALGLISHDEVLSDLGERRSYGSRATGRVLDKLSEISRDTVAFEREKQRLLLSGDSSSTLLSDSERQSHPTARSALNVERVEDRAGYLMPDWAYETMPQLAELVRLSRTLAPYNFSAGGGREQMESALYAAEANYPGALLWAAARSGDAALQSAAIGTLLCSADIQFVRAHRAATADDPVWGQLSSNARDYLDAYSEPGRGVLRPGCAESYLVGRLIENPQLSRSKPFMRSLFDETQDALFVRLVLAADLPRLAAHVHLPARYGPGSAGAHVAAAEQQAEEQEGYSEDMFESDDWEEDMQPSGAAPSYLEKARRLVESGKLPPSPYSAEAKGFSFVSGDPARLAALAEAVASPPPKVPSWLRDERVVSAAGYLVEMESGLFSSEGELPARMRGFSRVAEAVEEISTGLEKVVAAVDEDDAYDMERYWWSITDTLPRIDRDLEGYSAMRTGAWNALAGSFRSYGDQKDRSATVADGRSGAPIPHAKTAELDELEFLDGTIGEISGVLSASRDSIVSAKVAIADSISASPTHVGVPDDDGDRDRRDAVFRVFVEHAVNDALRDMRSSLQSLSVQRSKLLAEIAERASQEARAAARMAAGLDP